MDLDEGQKFKIAYADAISGFEMLVFSLIAAIKTAFQDAGLTNYKLTDAIVAHQTAEPLTKIWYSIYYCLVEKDPVLVRQLKRIRKAILAAIEERNVLAHTALWGPANVDIATTGLSTLLLRHSSEGVKPVNKNVRTSDLMNFKSECDDAARTVVALSLAVPQPDWKPRLTEAIERLEKKKIQDSMPAISDAQAPDTESSNVRE